MSGRVWAVALVMVLQLAPSAYCLLRLQMPKAAAGVATAANPVSAHCTTAVAAYLRSASCRGVPNSIVGMRLPSAYVSDRKLTRSIHTPLIFRRAVSKCFDWSGLDCMTAAEWVSLP